MPATDVDPESMVVCTGACGKFIDVNTEYRLSGQGLHDSDNFLIPHSTSALTLRVEPGSQGGWGAGFMTAFVGALSLCTSGGFLLGGLVTGDKDFTAIGAVTGAAGLVAVIAGAVMMGQNGTHVFTDTGVKLARPAAPRLTPGGLVF